MDEQLDYQQITAEEHEARYQARRAQYLKTLNEINQNIATSINFSELELSDEVVEAFTRNTSITSVNLAKEKTEGTDNLYLPNMLDLSRPYALQMFQKTMNSLSKKNYLQYLNLSGNDFSKEANFKQMISIVENNNNLKELILEDMWHLDANLILKLVNIIKQHPKLTKLSLDLSQSSLNVSIKQKGYFAYKIIEMIQKKSFTEFSLKIGHDLRSQLDVKWHQFMLDLSNNRSLKKLTLDLSSAYFMNDHQAGVFINALISMIQKNTTLTHFCLNADFMTLQTLNKTNGWDRILKLLEKNHSLLEFSINDTRNIKLTSERIKFNQQASTIILRNQERNKAKLEAEKAAKAKKAKDLASFDQKIPLPFGDPRLTPYFSLAQQKQLLDAHEQNIKLNIIKPSYSMSLKEYANLNLQKIYGAVFMGMDEADNMLCFVFSTTDKSYQDFMQLIDNNKNLNLTCKNLDGAMVRISIPDEHKKQLGAILFAKLFDRYADNFWSSPRLNQVQSVIPENSTASTVSTTPAYKQ